VWVVSFWAGLRVSFWVVSASLLEWVGSGRLPTDMKREHRHAIDRWNCL
jgi:hypothetical protein